MTDYTHDLNIANADGATVRADINDLAAALASDSHSTTAPATTLPSQRWNDTTANLRKRRNLANNGWQVEGTLDESLVISRSTNTALGVADIGKAIIATSTFTQTLVAAATLADGWFIDYSNAGTGIITLDPNSTETIDGVATIILYQGQSCRIHCNGTAFYTTGFRETGEVLLDNKTASGSASLDFTNGIGAGFERYRLDLLNINPATDDVALWLRFGDSGGFKSGATDYQSAGKYLPCNATSTDLTSAGTTQIITTPAGAGLGIGNGGPENIDGSVYFTNPEVASIQKAWWDLVYTNANGFVTTVTGGAAYVGGGMAMDRIQIILSSGNIATGAAKLYGIRST